MRDIQWGFPGAAYLLLFVLIFSLLFWVLYEWRRRVVTAFAKKECLDKLLVRRSRLYYLIKCLFFCAAWGFATLALMQPKGAGRYLDGQKEVTEQRVVEQKEVEGETITLRRKTHDVIFLLDASASMAVTDARGDKRRLDLAKEIVDEVVSQLDGQAVALYAFTSETSAVVPVTHDYLFFRLALRRVGIHEGDVGGTDFLGALEAG